MPESVLIDIVVKIGLLVLTLLVGVIGFFLRGLATEFNTLRKDQEEARLRLTDVQAETRYNRDDLRRHESNTQRRLDDIAKQQERTSEAFSRVQGDIGAMLSTLQHQTDALRRLEQATAEIGQRIARLEGESRP